jgi:hypothetical protein
MALLRAVRDRYDGRYYNPFQELECGGFYARALSSWSLLLAAQGFLHEGPSGLLGFKPALAPEDHVSFFSACEGWGLFSQKRTSGSQSESLEIRYGQLRIRRLVFEIPAGSVLASCRVSVDQQEVPATVLQNGSEIQIDLAQEVKISSGSGLQVALSL